VPRGATALNLKAESPLNEKGGRYEVDVDVELPQSVIDLMYAGNHGD